jgi:hypothetical protein
MISQSQIMAKPDDTDLGVMLRVKFWHGLDDNVHCNISPQPKLWPTTYANS